MAISRAVHPGIPACLRPASCHSRFHLRRCFFQLLSRLAQQRRRAAFGLRRYFVLQVLAEPRDLFVNSPAEFFEFIHLCLPLTIGNVAFSIVDYLEADAASRRALHFRFAAGAAGRRIAWRLRNSLTQKLARKLERAGRACNLLDDEISSTAPSPTCIYRGCPTFARSRSVRTIRGRSTASAVHRKARADPVGPDGPPPLRILQRCVFRDGAPGPRTGTRPKRQLA